MTNFVSVWNRLGKPSRANAKAQDVPTNFQVDVS